MPSVAGNRPTCISMPLAKRLFDTSLDLILVTDRRGTFIDIGPSSMTILGYRPEEMTGRVGSEFIYPQDLDHARENMRQARRGRQTRTFEARYVHKTGRAVTLAWNCVWSEPEQLHFFIGRDVTSLKRAERLKNEFVATLSHELRTPLTSIAGALSLLVANTDAALSASTLRLLTIAQANSQRLLHLVRGILDMDKVESGKLVFTFKRLDIRVLVEQAIDAIQYSEGSTNVCIKLQAPETAELRGDPAWLIKVFGNLLSNAIKFSPPGGEVLVAIERRGGNIRVSVRDHGPGVPDEFKDRLFEKFAQADNTNTRTKGGAGLALSVVKELVTRLGGKVGFADAPGGGAIFHVELPAWGRDADVEGKGSAGEPQRSVAT